MTPERTFARLTAAFVLACAGACSGDDPDDDGLALPDAAAAADALLADAAVVDCTGDHRESADASNNPLDDDGGSAEATGLSLAAGQRQGFTICGQIDPRQANERVADYDGFEFTVTGNEPVNLRIELVATPGDYGGISVELLRAPDGIGVWLAAGPFRNGYAMVAGKTVEPGTYWVSAAGKLPGPDVPIGYAISVQENALSCPRADREADYAETFDGPDSRGNDTIAVNHANPPPVLTDASTDAPEATDLLLDPATVSVLAGVSAEVDGSDGDSYLDRDAYSFATGPSTTELELRLAWPDGDVDLDVYLFEAGSPDNDYSSRLGIQTSGVLDELLTLNVDPGKEYWLWIAAYDDTMHGGSEDLPLPYDVTLCPRQHVPLLPLP